LPAKQLELNLWEAIAEAGQTPEEANLPMVLDLLDLTLADLDSRSQLRVAGVAVCQITDLFCDRSSFLLEELHAQSTNGEPRMSDDAFDRYVRQSVVVDFDQFIQPISGLSRKIPERIKDGNSLVSVVDKQVLLEELEQESLLSFEQDGDLVISTAHAEDVSAWVEAIANCIKSHPVPIRLLDLTHTLQLPMVEVWLGLLLGDFKLEQKGHFYEAHEIWIC
jgi:hypothetical protein